MHTTKALGHRIEKNMFLVSLDCLQHLPKDHVVSLAPQRLQASQADQFERSWDVVLPIGLGPIGDRSPRSV